VKGVLIGIETSGSLGSVAASLDGRVLARAFLEERGRHAGALPTSIATVLDRAGVSWRDVSGIAVGTGPGSFTGVRVAAAAANGLAHALRCPVHPVSSLAAAALSAEALPAGAGPWPPQATPNATLRRVLFDARGDRLFTAVFEVGVHALREVEPPHFARLGDIVTDPAVWAVCGDGAERHRDVLTGIGMEILEAPAGVPTADGVLRALEMDAEVSSFGAGEWEPTYLRETGAVRARKAGSP
jgi:tRNA threonylcarbamoyladenosine biosynthesis protein TsaB